MFIPAVVRRQSALWHWGVMQSCLRSQGLRTLVFCSLRYSDRELQQTELRNLAGQDFPWLSLGGGKRFLYVEILWGGLVRGRRGWREADPIQGECYLTYLHNALLLNSPQDYKTAVCKTNWFHLFGLSLLGLCHQQRWRSLYLSPAWADKPVSKVLPLYGCKMTVHVVLGS